MSTNANINRREFIGLGSMGIAGALAGAISPARAAGAAPHPPYEPPRGFPRFTANPETAQPPPAPPAFTTLPGGLPRNLPAFAKKPGYSVARAAKRIVDGEK